MTIFAGVAYDQDITIPDYENMLMAGVTAALAWPLPESPTYPDYEYENDNIPLERRKDTNTTSVSESSLHKSQQQQLNSSGANDSIGTNELDETLWQLFNYLEQNRRPDSFYFNDNRKTAHIPYSSEYQPIGQYDPFTKYLIDSYLKPTLQTTSRQTVPTVAATKSST